MSHPTIETLDWLIEYWPDLLDARLPMATRRPWQTPTLDAEGKELLDAAAYLDRYFRNPLGVRESPAPLDVNVLQTVLDVLVHADDLAAELGEWSVRPLLASPGMGELDARPYLAYARARLAEEQEDLGEPGPWSEWAEPIVHRVYESVARALAMLYTGQTVRVICPWCLGRTAENPIGGEYTWRIHELPGRPPQIAIICHGQCEPPQREVGTWWGGKPCWPLWDWERLAKRVRDHETHETIGA
ncbi:hypothetical protein [Nonomuraea lactucae]|uniref:hypothetical protein n=1 Tax=Nonomuraea lactucae TaxID=2249762 RepID=UPI000DE41767|nr:hypothetical protein [Nonomuraea lactucae]